MTPAEAQEIIRISSAYDMPYLVGKSVEFALFKVFGIESISTILLGAGQLTKEANAGRRFVDTGLLIATWMNVPITGPGSGRKSSTGWEDPRGAIAIARTNWLHSKYKIKNDDYLYALSLLAIEPATLIELYGWRSLTPMERQAYFIYWAEIGRRMNIENIPETLEDMQLWYEEYEDANMAPSPINKELAEQPVPPAWVKALISVALGLHKIYTKYLSLPRLKEFAYIPVLHDDFAKTGMCPAGVSACPFPSKSGGCEAMYRLHPGHGHVEPWYMPAPSIYTKLKTRVLASMGLYNTNAIPGPKFMPQGFRTEELGPVSYQQSGREAVLANAEAIHGGPLNGPWAFSAELSAHE